MAFGTRVAVTLVAITAVVLPTSCGGDTEGKMRAALTDDSCTYEGDKTPAAGMFTVEVENQTANFGAFALAALAEGSTIDDLELFVETAQQAFQESGQPPDPPAFYSQVVRVGVEAGASSVLPADVPAGTYALMCFIDDLPIWHAHVAGQLEVTG